MAASGRGFWLCARVTRRDVGGIVFTRRMAPEALLDEMMKVKEENRLLREQVATLAAHAKTKEQEVAALQHRIDQLCRHVFGKKTEKVDPNQLKLAFAEREAERSEQAAPPSAEGDKDLDAEVPPRHEPKKKRRGRRPLPEDLPRKRIEYHPAPEELVCKECGGEKKPMKGAEEITEQFDFKPASFFVCEHVRVKYSCTNCQEGVVCPPLPPMPIEKGRPGPGLLAHLVTSKYCDHLPLNRLERIFARSGVEIRRSTMCEWVEQTAFLVRPVVAEIKRQLLSFDVIQTDDTPIRVLDPEDPRGSKQGHLWAYRGKAGVAVFDYTASRARDGPERFLEGYEGYLQADAYAGYDRIYETRKILEVGCWAHARRKFFEALDSEPEAASSALARIRELYRVEAEANEELLLGDERRDFRREHATPHLTALFDWLEDRAPDALPQSPFGIAVAYTLKLKAALSRYLEYGNLTIDNNAVERALRQVAVGRKNWLFAGSDAGASWAATIYSLVVSCRELGLDPFDYFRDVIERVSTLPASRVAELTPSGWRAARLKKP